MMPNGYRRLEMARGINKLVQDYIKILYTRKQDDGYGTYLIDLSGTTVYDEDQFLTDIATELTSAALQLEKIQAALLAENEDALTKEETLSSVEVISMEYDKEDCAVYVSITLTSLASDSSATMNFKF
jgi:Cu2+-containing amine oxidase